MRRLSSFLAAVAGCALLLEAAAPASAGEDDAGWAERRYGRIHVIDFEGDIEPPLTAYTTRRIDQAEREGADLIVLRIESPGGRVDVTKDLADRIGAVKKGIRTVAWVPKYAYSGAAIVAISCDQIVLGPNAFLGDAQPGTISAEDGWKPVGEKAETVLRAWVRAFAVDNGHPPLLAEKLISQDMEVLWLETDDGTRHFVLGEEWRDAQDEDRIGPARKRDWRRVRTFPKGQLLTMTAPEARELGFAAALVPDEAALLAALSTKDARVVQHRMSASEEAGRWLLGVAGVISAVLLLGVILTISRGIGTHSIVGGAALVLLALVVATADLAHGFPILLLVVGLLLLLAEAFVIPGFGIAGILGILSFVGGLLFLGTGFRPGSPTSWDPEAMERFGFQLIATLLVGGMTIVLLARVFPTAPFGRRLLLPEGALATGAAVEAPLASRREREGVAVTPLRPAGTANLDGGLVDVVTEGDFVDAGARVRVVRVEGHRVVVREVASSRPLGASGSRAS